MENLESETAEAPIIIRRLKDELVAAKVLDMALIATKIVVSHVNVNVIDHRQKSRHTMRRLERILE